MISVFDGVENIVGKGENACYKHLLLFQLSFEKVSVLGSLKHKNVWKWDKIIVKLVRKNAKLGYFMFLMFLQKYLFN